MRAERKRKAQEMSAEAGKEGGSLGRFLIWSSRSFGGARRAPAMDRRGWVAIVSNFEGCVRVGI